MKDRVLCETVVMPERLDRELSASVRLAFRESRYLPLYRIQVVAHEGYVALKGEVPTYYLKQLAQCIAMSVEGVEELDNGLRVPEN